MNWSFNPRTGASMFFKIFVGLLIYGVLSMFYTPGPISVIVIAAILDTVELT